jgi:Family of unknown function (DUF6312)
MAPSDLRLSSNIRRVTILGHDATGQVRPTVLYEGTKKKKKQSRRLKPVETFVRRAADAVAGGAERYLDRHKKSNNKKRDGWLMEMSGNVYKASRSGSNRLKMNRWLSMW